jgi:SAM-dependent methyltransferase
VIYAGDLAYVHDAGFSGYAAAAAPEIARLLARHGIRRGRVVELGCGGGTVAKYLVDRGYEVLGIDQSPAMIRLARAAVPGATFKAGALATARIPPCAAILAIGEVVGYVTASGSHQQQVLSFFRHARAALQRGGLLVFDFMESADGRTFDAKSRAGAGWAIVTRATARGRTLTRDMVVFRKIGAQYRQSREVHRVRLYPRDEMRRLLTRAGFSEVVMRRSLGAVRLIRSDSLAIASWGQARPEQTPRSRRLVRSW